MTFHEKSGAPGLTTPSGHPSRSRIDFHTGSVAFLEFWTEVSGEALAFIADRLREDMKTQHQMLHCQSLTDLARLRARHVQQTVDDYAAETGRMMDIGRAAFDRMLTVTPD